MNPFEQLRVDETLPADPDPRFAAKLRAEVETALAPDIELPARKATTMTDAPSTTADSQTRQIITPYLAVDDAASALTWYGDGLGADHRDGVRDQRA